MRDFTVFLEVYLCGWLSHVSETQAWGSKSMTSMLLSFRFEGYLTFESL